MRKFLFLILCCALLFSCKKEAEVYEDNTIPYYGEITTLKVENYVNRLFIDLIGREPLDEEMDLEVSILESNNLSGSARGSLVEKLMKGLDPTEGDTTYNNAYHWKIYESTKARLLEGSSDAFINGQAGIFALNALDDSLSGNLESYTRNKIEENKLLDVIKSRVLLLEGEITIDEMYRRMMFNSIYDEINMNSFNFINASFDNMFYRFPTDAEFEQAYEVIEFNQPGIIFGQVAVNKQDYLNILSLSNDFEAGLVQWSYLALLGREPSTSESFQGINTFNETGLVNEIFKPILISDEYAGFN